MKIGLLTYYGDLNCGTNLQALACLKTLRSVFPKDEVEVIPLHGFNPPGVHPYFSHFTIKSLYHDLMRIKKYTSFRKSQLGVLNDKVEKNVELASAFIAARSYDMIFVGSDTILELDRIGSDSPLSLYWVSPMIKAKKILLAASSKNVQYESLTEDQKLCMQASLNDFSGYGVRDENTRSLISSFIPENRVQLIPDPTFSLEIDEEETTNYLKQKGLVIPPKSLLFHTTKADDSWAKKGADYYRAQGYRIYSLRPVPWADEVLNDLSPLEQLGIYRFFECVVTHRFHDAVFCLKNQTPMLLYTPNGFSSDKGGKNKFTLLLEAFSLLESNYMQSPREDLINMMENSIISFRQRKELISSMSEDYNNQFVSFVKQFQ